MNLYWDLIRICFVGDKHPLKGNHYIFHSVLLNTRWCETYQLIWHGPVHSRWSFKPNYKTFNTFILTITNIILVRVSLIRIKKVNLFLKIHISFVKKRLNSRYLSYNNWVFIAPIEGHFNRQLMSQWGGLELDILAIIWTILVHYSHIHFNCIDCQRLFSNNRVDFIINVGISLVDILAW